MSFEPKNPTHKVRVRTRQGKAISGTVGSAWLNANGRMSVSLNPGVVLSWKDDLFITIFPVDAKDDGAAEEP